MREKKSFVFTVASDSNPDKHLNPRLRERRPCCPAALPSVHPVTSRLTLRPQRERCKNRSGGTNAE